MINNYKVMILNRFDDEIGEVIVAAVDDGFIDID